MDSILTGAIIGGVVGGVVYMIYWFLKGENKRR
jgi:gas vesicle protein